MTTLEKAARAICAKRCVRAQILDEPCFDPETGRNAPCRANEAQLTLMPGIWDGAQAAFAVFSAALLDPSDEVVRAAMFAVCRSDGEYGINPRHLCADGCVQENAGARCPYESDARAALRAAGVKIAGKD